MKDGGIDYEVWDDGLEKRRDLPEKRLQAAVKLGISTIHLCPPEGSGTFPCCGKTPFEVPGFDRITLSKRSVTCGRP